MRYDQFRAAWDRALAASRLTPMLEPVERIEVHDLDRSYKVRVGPFAPLDARPFHVTALLSWQWDVLKSARTVMTEEDLYMQLSGRDIYNQFDTAPSWLRVDIVLSANLPLGEPIPMPAQPRVASWLREVTARLEQYEPLLADETVHAADDRGPDALAWKGDQTFKVSCNAQGELLLEGVHLAAWQLVALPRCWDDPDRSDPPPDDQLARLFARINARALGWVDCLDHLASSGSTNS